MPSASLTSGVADLQDLRSASRPLGIVIPDRNWYNHARIESVMECSSNARGGALLEEFPGVVPAGPSVAHERPLRRDAGGRARPVPARDPPPHRGPEGSGGRLAPPRTPAARVGAI